MSKSSGKAGSSGGSSTAEAPLKIWSCTACRRRKVRCDRRQPCAPCIRSGAECVFPLSGRIPRRSRVTAAAEQERATLLGRLRRLEAMVGELGEQVEHASIPAPGPESQESSPQQFDEPLPPSVEAGQGSNVLMGLNTPEEDLDSVQSGESFGEMIVAREDGDLAVKDRFWTVFCKEVEHIFEAVHGSMDAFHREDENAAPLSSESTVPARQYTSYYDFLLRNTSLAARKREELYPLPSQVPFLWQVYIENVDPFLKVLHVPTVTKALRGLRSSYQSLSPSMRALVNAMSLAAIMSLEEDEVTPTFGAGRQELLAQYRKGTEQALEQANAVETPDLTGLQAFVIYLSVLQHTGEGKAAWVLAGVLVRAAASINLHRDESHFSALEREVRWRLWWQTCLVDSRSDGLSHSETSRFKIAEQFSGARIPVSVDDAELETASPLRSGERWTDVTTLLLQCEVWRLSLQLQSAAVTDPDARDKRLQLVDESRARIETKYLCHIDSQQPLHTFVGTLVRLFFAKVNLVLLCHALQSSSTQLDPIETETIFTTSVAVIEYAHALQSESNWRGWRWQIHAPQPWKALHIVLSHLSRAQLWTPVMEHAWSTSKPFLHHLSDHNAPSSQLSALAAAVQQQRGSLQHSFGEIASDPIAFAPRSTDEMSRSSVSTLPPYTGLSDAPGASWDGTPSKAGIVNDLPSADMDWQSWNDVSGIFGQSWEFWDMGTF